MNTRLQGALASGMMAAGATSSMVQPAGNDGANGVNAAAAYKVGQGHAGLMSFQLQFATLPLLRALPTACHA